MSRRRHLEPFRKYSDRPSRDTRRLTEISLNLTNSPGALPSVLSNTSSIVACPTGFRALEPLKITSVMDSPRRYLAELSPITQRTASIMFDLPQPLGPTTAVILVGNGTVVGSTNDLNPASLMDFRRMSRALLLPENAQYLPALVYAKGLNSRLQPISVSAQRCFTKTLKEYPGLPNAFPEILKSCEVGPADGRPEVFQRFFKKWIFYQVVGIAHYPKACLNHFFCSIRMIGRV